MVHIHTSTVAGPVEMIPDSAIQYVVCRGQMGAERSGKRGVARTSQPEHTLLQITALRSSTNGT